MCGELKQKQWRSLSVSAEAVEKDGAAEQSTHTEDTGSHPGGHTGTTGDWTQCVTLELISEQFTLQH